VEVPCAVMRMERRGLIGRSDSRGQRGSTMWVQVCRWAWGLEAGAGERMGRGRTRKEETRQTGGWVRRTAQRQGKRQRMGETTGHLRS